MPLSRIILIGPESSGKSSLARTLAARLGAPLVPEFLRSYFAKHGRLTLADAIPIAQGQWDAEQAAAANADSHRPLICDTDLISSLVYSRHYYADQIGSPSWKEWEIWSRDQMTTLSQPAYGPRLYVLCGIDWPWIDDPQRDAPHLRDHFYDLFQQALVEQALPFLEVSGPLEDRLSAILDHFRDQI